MTEGLFYRLLEQDTPDVYYDYHDTWTDLMLITPSVYDKAVDLGVFPWMDVDPFYSERIVWSDQPS